MWTFFSVHLPTRNAHAKTLIPHLPALEQDRKKVFTQPPLSILPFQPLQPLSTPRPTSAAPTTTASNLPGFDFANSALAIVKSVSNSMAPFSKRAYRQAHQTIEFFEQQPTPTQTPSDARPTSTMTSAGNNSHRATMQGTIQKCPGPEKCGDCKAGRSAPTQAGGSSALPGKPRTFSS